MIIVLDIDGTLANGDHREHFIKATPPDWESFCLPSEMAKDLPIPLAQRAVKKLIDLKFPLVFLTGRNENLRDTTMRWLLQHFNVEVKDIDGTHGYPLFMRPVGNLLKPTEYKEAKVQEIQRDYGPHCLFVDDDRYMHPVYSHYGIALHAPECWDSMFPDHGELPPEDAWRK